jgi:hypothetical protein
MCARERKLSRLAAGLLDELELHIVPVLLDNLGDAEVQREQAIHWRPQVLLNDVGAAPKHDVLPMPRIRAARQRAPVLGQPGRVPA